MERVEITKLHNDAIRRLEGSPVSQHQTMQGLKDASATSLLTAGAAAEA
jgi:hypothetical protein